MQIYSYLYTWKIDYGSTPIHTYGSFLLVNLKCYRQANLDLLVIVSLNIIRLAICHRTVSIITHCPMHIFNSFIFFAGNFVGPLTWAKQYPIANGIHQSPININTKKTRLDFSLPDLKITYDPTKCATLTNSGRSFACSSQEQQTSKNYITGFTLKMNSCSWKTVRSFLTKYFIKTFRLDSAKYFFLSYSTSYLIQ